jgi:hypothetical protein
MEAFAYQAAMCEEVTVSRQPDGEIVVFREQIRRLMEGIS